LKRKPERASEPLPVTKPLKTSEAQIDEENLIKGASHITGEAQFRRSALLRATAKRVKPIYAERAPIK
jgi:hypothetical protein